ncbi:hypothetical protein VNO77_19373 [Canavalia gladiata]|uniref:Uncharacterized protein n=1 Tax=Canavalia gladiata TaxID=3824 RepID=A0AAN9LR79_CANGL
MGDLWLVWFIWLRSMPCKAHFSGGDSNHRIVSEIFSGPLNCNSSYAQPRASEEKLPKDSLWGGLITILFHSFERRRKTRVSYFLLASSSLRRPISVGEGWSARKTGTKLSVTINNDLYALGPYNSPDSAKIKVYNYEGDTWRAIARDIPIHDFFDSESPYLSAGLLGKVDVITKDTNHNIVVLQANMQNDLVSSQPLSSLVNSSSELIESTAGSENKIYFSTQGLAILALNYEKLNAKIVQEILSLGLMFIMII